MPTAALQDGGIRRVRDERLRVHLKAENAGRADGQFVGPRAALSGTEALEGGERGEGRGPKTDVGFLHVVPGVKHPLPSAATNSRRAD